MIQDLTEQQLKTVQTILENQTYDYSCAMALVPEEDKLAISRLWAMIDPTLLVEKGIENDPHITILYGIHDADSTSTELILKGTGPWKATITSLSLFKSDKYDVLKLGVKSADLDKYNALLRRSLDYTTNYPDYIPHLTVAYLKAGTGDRYIKPTELDGKEITITDAEFSSKNGNSIVFSLLKSIEEDAPVNCVGGGHIAGVGIGPQGEPGIHVKKKWTSKIYKD